MEALVIALLIILGFIGLLIAIAIVAYAGVVVFYFLPAVIGIPLGIWLNQYSTPLAVTSS